MIRRYDGIGRARSRTPDRSRHAVMPTPSLRSFSSFRSSLTRRRPGVVDLVVLIAVVVALYGIVRVGRGATVSFAPTDVTTIDTAPSNLPYDVARSLLRMFVALGISTVFTFVYGYVAGHSRRAEKVLIPLLDILQSVPILGFLSITVSAFIALAPGSLLGLEMASVFAIFTSQAWNMTFSFYHSVATLPRELDELSRNMGFTRWMRFWKIEVPHAAIGLTWNAMMSMGGGWFFLSAAEAISVVNAHHALPGIGSYAAAAIDAGDMGRVGLAIATMVVVVLAVNFLFWRPLIAFAERYKLELAEASDAPRSRFLDFLRGTRWPRLMGTVRRGLAERLGRAMAVFGTDSRPLRIDPVRRRTGDVAFALPVGGLIVWGVYSLVDYTVRRAGLGIYVTASWLGFLTLLRVVVLVVVATVVWVPIGVKIGLSQRWSRLAQPVVQILASFPANFLFPFATLAFIHFGISLNYGGVVLMSLGAQWYILFNVIAGAQAIPTDLREAMDDLGVRGWQRWKRLILPAVMSSYVTGAITASGGAWNASIVAEIVTYGGTTLTASGLGAYIALASENGQFAKILAGVAVMAVYVVGINRLVWRRLYRVAERRYSLS
ncbi:MAG: ABC transporter permease subunit [Microthrixaceae bacterium]